LNQSSSDPAFNPNGTASFSTITMVGITSAALDITDIVTVNAGVVGKRFLTPALSLTEAE
jgi:hypothetical protein